MLRRATAVAISAVVLLGLVGCSGSTSEPASPTPVETVVATEEALPPAEETAPAPVEPEGSAVGDPALQACLDISNKLAVASAEMLEIMNEAEAHDMQATVDMYTELADALGEIADTTSLDDLKDAALAAQADFAAIRDGLKRVYIDDDMSGLSELTEAMTSMQTTYPAMLELCGN